MNSCCRLGSELEIKKNVLYETDNFFVFPARGQMGIEGYVLLCSIRHFVGIGNIPKENESELEGVLRKTKNILSEVYNSEILIFEHGPRLGCHKGGGCLEHAHLHLVPTSVSVIDFLNQLFEPEEINNFDRLREIYKKQQSSYLFVESQDEKRYIIETDISLPSQYLRQVIASKLGIISWDWRIYPDIKTFESTIKALKDKF